MQTQPPSFDDQQRGGNSKHGCSDDYVERLRNVFGAEACERRAMHALPSDFRLSVIVPIFNECNTLALVVDKLRGTGLPMQCILVDDGSTDGSGELVETYRGEPDIIVIRHAKNQGKGGAIRSGITVATGTVIVIQDADDEYDPADFRCLLQPILSGDADVALGTRFSPGNLHHSPCWHRAINQLITAFASAAIGVPISDIESCYKMASRQHFQAVVGDLRESRFGIEIELMARWARRGLRFTERPIHYNFRRFAAGKKIGWRDGISALRCIVQYGWLRR